MKYMVRFLGNWIKALGYLGLVAAGGVLLGVGLNTLVAHFGPLSLLWASILAITGAFAFGVTKWGED